MINTFGHTHLFYALVLIYGWALIGCGDLKTPRELQTLRNREQINQRLAEIKPLVGDYEGTLLNARSALNEPFRMSIVIAGEPFGGGNIPDETTAPTLRASVTSYTNSLNSGTYIIVPFNRSDYDAKSKNLSFYSDEPQGSLLILVEGKRLTGSWNVVSRGMIGNFDVLMVR